MGKPIESLRRGEERGIKGFYKCLPIKKRNQ